MHPSYFKPKTTVGFQFPSLHKKLWLPALLPVDIRRHTEPKHTCCPPLHQRGPGRQVPVLASLEFTGLLQATGSPVGSQIPGCESSEPGHIPVSQDCTSHLAALCHDLFSALTSGAGLPELSYGTGGDRAENIQGVAAEGYQTEMPALPVRSDQA